MENLNIDKLNRTTLVAIVCMVMAILVIGIFAGKYYFMPSATCIADRVEQTIVRLQYGASLSNQSHATDNLKLVGSNALSPDMSIIELYSAYEHYQPQGRMILDKLVQGALLSCS